ncbi:MAG TPA: FUSC family protein [Streptosporangiaceae bacterium]|nr:FUSC family protein [Streptosporangiaceae bacterium]
MAACLPARPAGLSGGTALPGSPLAEPGPSARRAGRRLAADLRGGRAFLAAELSQSGWLDFGAFRWRDLSAGQSVRATTGVLVPLILGVATGKVAYGSYAALGALPAGFVSFRGVSRTRVLAVLFAAAGMAISTFAGATAADGQPWLLVPLVFIWAYVTGLCAALGPTALTVTLQWPIALLIASALPLGPGPAAVRAGLVLAGGLWQCLLVVSSWMVNRGSAERTALAASYLALGGYAGDVAAGRHSPPAPAQLAGSYVLGDPNPLMRTAARQDMQDLAEEAERIRATLTALSVGRPGDEPGSARRGVLAGAAQALSELAASLTSRPGQRAGHLAAARRQLDALTAQPGPARQWADEALLGQLRSAVRIARRLNDAEAGPGDGASPAPVPVASAKDAWLTVQASTGTASESGRHALRLAVVAAVAEVIAQASGLAHGYWIVLTIFIVLRPDYSSTLYRGLQRAAGTAVGAGLGVATVLLVKVSVTALLCGIAVSLLAAYAVFTVNYLLYAVFLTDFVVVLLAMLGSPPDPTAEYRLIGTGIGTGLAIIAYLLWPTWESTSATEKFARLLATQGRYASALLRAYTRPEGSQPGRLRRLQLTARRARADAEASADRLAGEPDHPPISAPTARALESVGHRIAQANLTLGAALAAHHARTRSSQAGGQPGVNGDGDGDRKNGGDQAVSLDPDIQPDLDRLADGVDQATAVLSAALRARGDGRQPGGRGAQALPPLPPLRPLLQVMWEPDSEAAGSTGATARPAASGTAPGSGDSARTAPGSGDSAGPAAAAARPAPAIADGERGGLFTAADGLVDAINTAAHVLRQ